MPETMSFTSVWLPKEIAMPKTEAPAISGVMFTPKNSSATITATTPIRTAAVTRSSGIMVLMREAGGPAASPSAIASAAFLFLRAM